MEDLKVVSGYSLEQMFLFSVEVFEKEVKKFDLKLEGEYKERKAEMELQKAKEAALAAAKKK